MIFHRRCVLLLVLIFLSIGFAVAQTDESSIIAPETQEGMIFKPTIGLGVGMFTFYGDLSKGQKINSPIVSKLGYDLRVSQTLTPHFEMYFHVLFGKVGANERSANRNLNFESTLRMGGLGLTYNFHHILKEDRIIEPYICMGFESFEFLSKTDLVDAYGTEYHYWSDGSIRNLDENDANAKTSKVITRDYVYETDVRQVSIKSDGINPYSERSFAIPIGLGANLHTTDRIKFRVGTTYYLTFTDNIDGITDKSLGERKGDARNDHFLYTSFSLNYNLTSPSASEFDEDYSDVDFLAIDMGDEDGDGVIDFKDYCAHTPSGAIVDIKGCPLDADGDGVPDYMDQEENTPDSLYADAVGIGLSQDELEKRYKMYVDSTGAYANTESASHMSDRIIKKSYALRYEGKTDEISHELANLFLSYTNTSTFEENGTTVFEVGDYDNLPEIIKKALQLQSEGIVGAEIVEKDGKGGSTVVPDNDIANAAFDAGIELGNDGTKTTPESSELVYRIQLGAFSRPLGQNVFSDIPDLIKIKGEDGLTRYYTGAYASYQEAARKKIDMVSEGFNGAFVVPLKAGKKVPLSETGSATPVNKEVDVNENTPISSNTKNLKFKVQVGAYNKQIPIDILEKFMLLGSIEQRKTEEGITKYVVGSFNTPDEAKAYKEEVIQQGYSGAFLVGEFNGKIISIEEALELYK